MFKLQTIYNTKIAKYEILNSNFETNPKFECSNVQNNSFSHSDFGDSILFRISCFVFRI